MTAVATTHALLLQADVLAPDQLMASCNALAAALPAQLQPPYRLRFAHAVAPGRLYAYAHFAQALALESEAVRQMACALALDVPGLAGLRASRLERVFALAGASAGEAPAFLYSVEMDPEPGWQAQLFEWYDVEHMPGLAAVPGCTHAARYLNHDHGPLSLACYDLRSENTKGSAPWLAMTDTEWSSRMRPHFTHTLRTMFDLVPVQDQSHPTAA